MWYEVLELVVDEMVRGGLRSDQAFVELCKMDSRGC